jgi:predicted extracellular nuclease
MSGQKIIDGLQEAIAAERHASDVCKRDLQARIDALEAQIAAADRLADVARRASHATTNDGITGPIYTDEAVALQRALAAYRAARVQP